MMRGIKKAGRRQGQRARALDLVRRCRRTQKAAHDVGVSAITVSELEFDAQKCGRYEDEMAAVAKVLAPFHTYDYAAASCAPHYDRIRHELEQAGRPIGAMDLLIAAHALGLDATLVTNNLAHLQRVPGLKVTDWR
jgi:tRNA(fMet)-specific endonuclease VapC